MRTTLTSERASFFARIALGHVTREYPNKPDHVLSGADDARTPADLHPVFYGSYDWHSCVHGYWMLAYLLRRFPGNPEATEIRQLFDTSFLPHKVAAECAYLAEPTARGFKRPYGWAWLLKLAEELTLHEDRRWSDALAPLAEVFAQRFRDFLPLAIYPVRVGTHFNTAFGLRMAADYASATNDMELEALLYETAQRWYRDDVDCPAWGEPSGDDFQSSALIEAECMRRLLPSEVFLPWFARFLPDIRHRQPNTLFRPAVVSDRTDGKIAHLDGLNLSRAWCWRSLASALPRDNTIRTLADEAAECHLAVALPHLAGDYMGEHWLATFAVLALEA
ncbi:DUF2891 domain-containing protein [Paraburkholderia tropica]|uniref:DUF2891 domain-containing protein n=1 Tax=Paraburkholderia tropica TaxID=92647 RepID=UPI0007ED1BF4|nr:DUF2891 domain-containing protein [Paraburkholderia tropica]OBR54707.1 hypothetical protein A6456_37460 [Paraburkholderia tropica]